MKDLKIARFSAITPISMQLFICKSSALFALRKLVAKLLDKTIITEMFCKILREFGS